MKNSVPAGRVRTGTSMQELAPNKRVPCKRSASRLLRQLVLYLYLRVALLCNDCSGLAGIFVVVVAVGTCRVYGKRGAFAWFHTTHV